MPNSISGRHNDLERSRRNWRKLVGEGWIAVRRIEWGEDSTTLVSRGV